MRNTFVAVLFSLSVVSTPVLAGPGHAHAPATQESVMEMAVKKRDQLISAGKLDKSWAKVVVDKVEQKPYAKGPEWVVTFRNDAIADSSKRTLYLFFALDGHYLAANFTGK